MPRAVLAKRFSLLGACGANDASLLERSQRVRNSGGSLRLPRICGECRQMGHKRPRFAGWGPTALLILTLAPRVHAAGDGDRAAARRLGYSGVEAYQAGRYPAALEQLEKAYSVLHVPSIGLWLARALARSGKLVEATERYLEIGRLEPEGDLKVQKRAQQEAEKELVELNKRLPNLTIGIEGVPPSDVRISVDGVPLASALVNEARPVNPGRHTIVGTYGNERAESVVQLAEGERATARLTLHMPPEAKPTANVTSSAPVSANAPAPDEPSASSWTTGKTVAVALGVVGVAGVAFAGVEVAQFNKEERADCRMRRYMPQPGRPRAAQQDHDAALKRPHSGWRAASSAARVSLRRASCGSRREATTLRARLRFDGNPSLLREA